MKRELPAANHNRIQYTFLFSLTEDVFFEIRFLQTTYFNKHANAYMTTLE